MNQKKIHKLIQSGKYSRVVVLPREFLQTLNWKRNQKLQIELNGKKRQIIIKDAKT